MFRKLPVGSLDPVFVRTALLATAAVLLSYTIGSSTSFIAADIAAIWALVAVRATFHAAIRETTVQITGTIIGGLIGYLAIQTYGFNHGMLAILVLFSFAAGMLLRIGIEGSVIMGFTIIAVTSNSFSLESTEARVSGVILGTLIATFFSLFVSRGTPQKRVENRYSQLMERKSQLLSEISETVAAGDLNVTRVLDLKIKSKILVEDFEKLEDEAEELKTASKWSPLTKEDDAIALFSTVVSAKDDAAVIVDMADSLENLSAGIPADAAAYAKKNIDRVVRSIVDPDLTVETTVLNLPTYTSVELTPTQIVYTNDFIAATEKLRKRRKRGATAPES